MQVRALSCPSCGSPDLEQVTWKRRRCRYCKTESVLSPDRTRLELAQWECLECGFNNESGVAFCGQCGAKLTKTCPQCGQETKIGLRFCNLCGANYEAVLAEQDMQERRERLEQQREGIEQRRQQELSEVAIAEKRASDLGGRFLAIWFGVWLLTTIATWFPIPIIATLIGLHGSDAETMSFRVCVAATAIGGLIGFWIANRWQGRQHRRIHQDYESQRQFLEQSFAEELEQAQAQTSEEWKA